MASPFAVGAVYVALRSHYFPKYKSTSFRSGDFTALALLLEKEKISYERYLEFVFGILDFQKPLGPKALADPILIRKYKEMVA